MIKVNGCPLDIISFPDKTKKLNMPFNLLTYDGSGHYSCMIDWRYESDEEFLQIAFIKKHIDNFGEQVETTLYMPYIPNARMDRTHEDEECFTLKHFASLINDLKFSHVEVFDPHSTVSEALFNNIVIDRPKEVILDAIMDMKDTLKCKEEDIVIFFPDEGSQKRYLDDELKKYPAFFGNKIRDWNSGHIMGLSVETHTDKSLDYLKGKTVIIIDDIISAGGTIYYSIKELEKYGVENICAYASHLESTMFDKTRPAMGEYNPLLEMLIKNTIFKKLYTTDSFFVFDNKKRELVNSVGDNEKIVVFNLLDEDEDEAIF